MWPKKTIDWIEDGTAFVSVPFTWDLPETWSRCVFLKALGYAVRAGGPAVNLMSDYLADVAEIGGEVDALSHHNPNAVFTSRGCPNRCEFCAVPIIEGDLREMGSWEPKPIVCDNNLLACSRTHVNKVLDSLKGVEGVDFNQGLDARLLTKYHADRLAELDLKHVRLAWDHTGLESQVMSAIQILKNAGIPHSKMRIYVLFGFRDTPEDARYRFEILQKMRIWPAAQRYQPLDALVKNDYVNEAAGWTEHELKRFSRYWNRQHWLAGVPFDEYERSKGK